MIVKVALPTAPRIQREAHPVRELDQRSRHVGNNIAKVQLHDFASRASQRQRGLEPLRGPGPFGKDDDDKWFADGGHCVQDLELTGG